MNFRLSLAGRGVNTIRLFNCWICEIICCVVGVGGTGPAGVCRNSHSHVFCIQPILLQKSFWTRDQNFFWLYTRLSCKYATT